MSRRPPAWTAFVFAVAICAMTAFGCNSKTSSNGTGTNGDGGQPAKVVIEFPDGVPGSGP